MVLALHPYIHISINGTDTPHHLPKITQNMTKHTVTNSIFVVTGRKGRVTGNIAGVTNPICAVTIAKRGVTNTICNANEPGNGANGHEDGANDRGNGRKIDQNKTVGATPCGRPKRQAHGPAPTR
ncbi:hypothetical protein KAH81_05860 [bacterium]|nr:hypothetical protein [bacterium]